MPGLGPKVDLAYFCLLVPGVLEHFRSLTERDDFLVRVRQYLRERGDGINREELFSELEEFVYELYEYVKQAIEVLSRQHLESSQSLLIAIAGLGHGEHRCMGRTPEGRTPEALNAHLDLELRKYGYLR